MPVNPKPKKGMDSAQITGAASSYARKYALNGLFLIDDTKDADTLKPADNEPMKINTDQQTFILDLLEESKADKVKFYEWAKVVNVSDIPASDFDKVITALKKKIPTEGA